MFISPFITWFLVAVFVFNMQFLWKYIDDIVGKGLEISIILELLFYQALAMIPKAMIFGTALASVMTLGNLSEHYELAAMKSSGMSLLRVMRPLMLWVSFIGFSSFLIANYAIPVASLKFKARLFDIRKQKPALNLEAGKFNDDFKDFSIYIANKDPLTQELEGVRLYDHTKQQGNVSQTNAKRGELFFSKDERYLVVKLYDGERQEERGFQPNKANKYPYLRVSFKEYISLFDMQQFDTKQTNEDAFGSHPTLLSIGQIIDALDSIDNRKFKKVDELQKTTESFFYARRDTGGQASEPLKLDRNYLPDHIKEDANAVNFYENIADSLLKTAYGRAVSVARSVLNQAENAQKSIISVGSSQAEFKNEIHQKIMNAIACILFLFVGAPMGAIIRKGGFGLPVLVAFVFFMLFFVLNLMGEHLSKNMITPCWVGAWLPVLVLFPMAIFLTYKAVNDSPIFSFRR
jgi:lipopolysaccharide export system permease protein